MLEMFFALVLVPSLVVATCTVRKDAVCLSCAEHVFLLEIPDIAFSGQLNWRTLGDDGFQIQTQLCLSAQSVQFTEQS